MNKNEIEGYKAALFHRRGEARIVGRRKLVGGSWSPEENQCHQNVTIWCAQNSQFTPVRGWLYFEMEGSDCALFLAHSVVREPSGVLADITPSNASQDYPFIESQLSEEDFSCLVEIYERLWIPKAIGSLD